MEAGGLEKLRRRFWIERGAYLFVILVLLAANFWGKRAPSTRESREASHKSESALRYVIFVNKRPVVALRTEREAKDALDTAKALYAANLPNLLEEPAFKESVSIERQRVPESMVFGSPAEAARALVGESERAGIHRVKRGETAWSICRKEGITEQELSQLNPGRDLSKLQVGEVLRIKPDAVVLTVVTKDVRTKREYIPPPLEKIPSPKMYKGKQIVVQPGRWGVREVRLVRTCENGVPVSVVKEGVRVVSEPKRRVVIVGTLPRK